MKDKKEVIESIYKFLQEQGEVLQGSEISPEEKATQLDVLLDTMHFLKDYDENVKVLNEYWIEKRQREKFEKATGITPDSFEI